MKMPEPLNPPAPIKPTVGRIVHFHLGGSIPPYDARGTFTFAPDQDTYAAMVAAVDSRGLYVNLTVSDHYGNTFGRTIIPFVQPGDERPAGAWCEWPPIQNAQTTKVEQLERKEPPPLADPFSRVQEKFKTRSGTITRGDSLILAAKVLQEAAADLYLKGRHPQAGRSSGELKTALLAIIPLIQAVADTLIGEPPTLNTPADPEQASRRAEEKHANDLVEAKVAAIRAEKERIRHPVIGAAQELDNNGVVINGTTSTETTDNGERRFAALDQVVESVKAHNANVPPEVIEREIDEAVTAVRAGHPVDEPGTGPFDAPAPHLPQD